MSAPTVRWSYSFEQDGKRHNSTYRGSTELAAIVMMHSGAQSSARSKFRIRKLTRKPKPKVVAKWSCTTVADANGGCTGFFWPGWLQPRVGKRIRITLEELADE